jgi:hypothetical protein
VACSFGVFRALCKRTFIRPHSNSYFKKAGYSTIGKTGYVVTPSDNMNITV